MVWIKRLALFISLTVIVGAAVFSVMKNGKLFVVRAIPVEIIEEQSDSSHPFKTDGPSIADLKTKLGRELKRFEKRRIWDVDISDIERLVRENDWVRNVRVSRLFPDKLGVEIIPRAAVFLLATPKGQIVPVAADGRLIRTFNPALLPDAPVLKGARFYHDESLRKQAIEFAAALPEEGPLSRSSVSEIEWASDDGFVITLLPSRVRVVLGVDRIALKVARVEQIIDYMSTHQLEGRVIDASFSKKVLVRLRKGP